MWARRSQRVAQCCYNYQRCWYSSAPARKSRYDKSMIKPVLWLVVFGSLLTHVSNGKKTHAEMEKRYSLKQQKLRQLIQRVEDGDTNFNVDQELALVNKLFERSVLPPKWKPNASMRFQAVSVDKKGEEEEEESLDSIWKSLVDSIEEAPKPTKPAIPNTDEIVMDKSILDDIRQHEKLKEDYKARTDVHVIVDNPGELTSAAKDTAISKFL